MTGWQDGLARLRRAFGLGSAQVLVRLACSFISIKFTAVYLGPGGLAQVAQFNSLVTLGQGLIGAGVTTAVVRVTPEYQGDADRQSALWATSARIALGLAATGMVALVLASPWLAGRLLGDANLAWAIGLCALAIAASVFNNLLLGILNGLRAIGRVVQSNVLATMAGLLVFAPACVHWGLVGGLAGSALVYAVALAVTLMLLPGQGGFALRRMVGAYDKEQARRIWAFYPMLVAHATLSPLSTMLVRDAMSTSLSLHAAGLWQAAWRLSEVYLMLITTSVSLFFMPRLGELAQQAAALRSEVWRTLAAVLAITAASALAIGLLRDVLVRAVFSSAFDGAQALMPVQLLGDVLKMGAWTLGFVLVSQVKTRWYVAIEVLVPLIFVLATKALIPTLGPIGAMWAYVTASLVHLLLALVALRKTLITRLAQPTQVE